MIKGSLLVEEVNNRCDVEPALGYAVGAVSAVKEWQAALHECSSDELSSHLSVASHSPHPWKQIGSRILSQVILLQREVSVPTQVLTIEETPSSMALQRSQCNWDERVATNNPP